MRSKTSLCDPFGGVLDRIFELLSYIEAKLTVTVILQAHAL